MAGRLGALLFAAFMIAGTGAASADPIRLTDIAGREVVLEKPAERVVLSESGYIEALAIVMPEDPVRPVVGMAAGPAGLDPSIERQILAKWPAYRSIALFGGRGQESISVEKILVLKPDVAIFGIADHGPGAKASELIAQLQGAGIAVVFIDFRMDPLKNTARSIEILGAIFARGERAAAFAKYHRDGLAMVRDRVSRIGRQRPKVFLQAHVGRMECCIAMANGMLGPLVGLAGGANVSALVSPGPVGRHTDEFLISQQVDVFIGTASGQQADFAAGKPMIVLGGAVEASLARASFEGAVDRPAMRAIPAWQTGRVHAIWHGFYNSPFNLFVALQFAKWIHPDAFEDIEPDALLRDMYSRFSPFEVEGTYAVSLDLERTNEPR